MQQNANTRKNTDTLRIQSTGANSALNKSDFLSEKVQPRQ